MLAVLAPPGARLDAGSVGLALARRWSESAGRALFVDVDTTGSRLAQRYGAATRAEYSPAVRGMPSLIVAREPLELKTLADHCYSLGDSQGSLWALFAPFNVQAGVYAAGWLAERADALAAVDRYRSVVLAASLSGASRVAPLLQSCAVAAVVAPVESRESAAALWSMCRDAGLMGFRTRPPAAHRGGLVPAGRRRDPGRGRHACGREDPPRSDDERLLRPQGGRKERAVARAIEEIVATVQNLLRLGAESRPGVSDGAGRGPAAGEDPALGRTPRESVPANGAGPVAGQAVPVHGAGPVAGQAVPVHGAGPVAGQAVPVHGAGAGRWRGGACPRCWAGSGSGGACQRCCARPGRDRGGAVAAQRRQRQGCGFARHCRRSGEGRDDVVARGDLERGAAQGAGPPAQRRGRGPRDVSQECRQIVSDTSRRREAEAFNDLGLLLSDEDPGMGLGPAFGSARGGGRMERFLRRVEVENIYVFGPNLAVAGPHWRAPGVRARGPCSPTRRTWSATSRTWPPLTARRAGASTRSAPAA